jgi:peptidoglycan/xylan/chitin deacetylase (PgdA/CDA1 family)
MRILLLPLLALAAAQGREVAITIDDLPVAHSGPNACQPERLKEQTTRLLEPLRARRIPVTAFVVGRACPDLSPAERKQALELWRSAGVELGNHTYSHRDLNDMPIAEYEADILRNDRELKATLGVDRIRYFRWPFLHTGKDQATKQRLQKFLAGRGYREAPVTFDNSDWMFSSVYSRALGAGDAALAEKARAGYVPYMESVIEFFEKRSVEVVGREFPQILLLHANLLNARMLPELLAMLERRGYRFVSLDEALRDPVYGLPERYAGPGGFSWLHRWSKTKGMPNHGEPDEPEWLVQASRQPSKP